MEPLLEGLLRSWGPNFEKSLQQPFQSRGWLEDYWCMCKWKWPFWGTVCQRAPKSLSSAQAAPLYSASIERARKCLQGWHCHSTHSLLFRGSAGVTRGGQRQFATQTLRVHFLGIESFHPQPPSLPIILLKPGSERKVLAKETRFSLLRE